MKIGKAISEEGVVPFSVIKMLNEKASQWQSAGLVIERSRVRSPAEERRENFLLQGQLSALPPPCHRSST